MELASKKYPHRFYNNTPFQQLMGNNSKSRSPVRSKAQTTIKSYVCKSKEEKSLNADLPNIAKTAEMKRKAETRQTFRAKIVKIDKIKQELNLSQEGSIKGEPRAPIRASLRTAPSNKPGSISMRAKMHLDKVLKDMLVQP